MRWCEGDLHDTFLVSDHLMVFLLGTGGAEVRGRAEGGGDYKREMIVVTVRVRVRVAVMIRMKIWNECVQCRREDVCE